MHLPLLLAPSVSPHRSRTTPTRRAVVALAAALVGGASALGSQPPTPGRPEGRGSVRWATAAYNTEHGLPSSIVTGVVQTPDGYLWLTSHEGLVRFDGASFRTFTDGDIPGLGRGSFVSLAVAPDPGGDPDGGTLWAGSESGELVRLHRGRWRVFGAADGLPRAGIVALAVDRNGALLVGSRLGLWRVADDRVTRLPLPGARPDPAVAALAIDAGGTIWIGTVADGLLRVRGDTVVHLTTRDGLADDRIDALYTDPDGTLWAGAYGTTGVMRLQGGRMDHLGTHVGTTGGTNVGTLADTVGAPRRVRFIRRDRTGTLWLAAENGLFALRGPESRLAEFVPLGELGAVGPGPEAEGRVKGEGIAQDAEGNIWVATRQSGLFRLRAARFATLGTADGLPQPFVFAVDGDGAGGAWVATTEGAVHLAAGGGVQRVPTLGDHNVRDVLRTPDGDVWLATTSGLTRLPGGRADRGTTYRRRDGLSDDRVRALSAGRGGAVWAATYVGVTEWRDGRLRSYGPMDGIPDGYVLSVHEDAAGTLWVGTQAAGLLRCPAEADPSARRRCEPGALAGQPVFRLTEEADGTLWAGTSRGLARLRRLAPGGPIAAAAVVTPQHGLPGRTIFQALDDERGGLWLTGPWGIGHASHAALDRAADAIERGAAASVEVTPFGRGDGMAAREATSIGRAWRALDGTLWFPTPLGVAVVDPGHLPTRPAPPRAHVELVLADGVVLDDAPERALERALRAGTRALELQVAAPSFTAPERVRFRWRLEGFDGDWVDGGTRRAAYYTNLSPGSYRFVVQARAGDGPWGPPATASLHLAPHPWQRPSILAAAVAALGVAVVAAYRRRTRTLTRAAAERATQEAREEALRAATLRDDLTGLYNRRGLLALAEQEIRASRRSLHGFTLLLADLDGLKAINDTFGHAAGDAAIMEAADVLRETFRDADIVARLGGDEFVVVLRDAEPGAPSGVGSREALVLARRRIAETLARHNAAAERTFALAMSVGTSRFDPSAPETVEALLADADRRMYGVKRARRDQPPRQGAPAGSE